MISILLEDKSIENFEKALLQLQESSKSIIILSCSDNHFSKELLDPSLKACKLPLIGGIFPSIVYKNKLYDEGTILLGLNTPFKTTCIHDISESKDYDDIIEQKLGILDEKIHTMFLFFDGISNHIDTIVQSLFNNYGLSINYFGGSSGIKDFLPEPVIFSNEGLLEDAAIFATTTAESTIGVKHGWEPLTHEVLQVTKAKDNVIYEIDYKSAFSVFKEFIESNSDTRFSDDFSKDSFFNVAKSYPLGITRLSGDAVVRVANQTDGETLTCTGDVLGNSYIQILHTSSSQQLIDAAQNASKLSQNNNYQNSFKFYIGCLARWLVLNEEFYKELDAVYEEDEMLIGALSLGEIANNQDHYLELYNSTAVVAKISDDR